MSWRCARLCFFGRRLVGLMLDGSHHGKGEHDERDVTMPAVPGSGFVVVEIALRTSQTFTSRRRPPRLAGGIIGSTSVHSASVRSLGYRRPRRSAARRCSGFHISGHPQSTIRVPHNESQMIHPNQQLSGSALRRSSRADALSPSCSPRTRA